MLLRKRMVVVHNDSSDYSDEKDEVVKKEEANLREGGEQDDAT